MVDSLTSRSSAISAIVRPMKKRHSTMRAFACIDGSELCQCFVEQQYFFRSLDRYHCDIHIDVICALRSPGVVDEDLSHAFGYERIKLSAIFPAGVLSNQFHQGFIDEGGRLQDVARSFVAHVVVPA